MIVHGIADDVGCFVSPAVIDLVQYPEDTPLDRFQAVIHIGDGAIFDDIGGVVQKIAVHHRPEIGVGIGVFADRRLAVGFRSGNLHAGDIPIFRSLIRFVTHTWIPPDWS